jgi:hypothetical protein
VHNRFEMEKEKINNKTSKVSKGYRLIPAQ